MVGLKQGSTLKSGKYKIVKTLGQGSFGITYLATTRISMDGQLGKMDVTVNVTIKEFFMSDLNSRASDGTSVERTNSTLVKNYLNKFRKEAENLAKLNHPNIVKVLEVFDENNTTYYVMEYIDGETIDDYIKSKGHLSESESLKITQEVCLALSYMHEYKMLHLDLKPKNIMRNSEGHVFLIDFGLAKQCNDNGEPESSTTLGLGTPGYAPIEQAHYKQDGTFPVTLDIYAVGASLYKMLTGKTPPESSYVLNEGLPNDVLSGAGVSNNVISVVEKAMAPIKKNRYQTVIDLSKAISTISSSSIEKPKIEEEEDVTIIDIEDSGKRRKVEINPNTDEIGSLFIGSSCPENRNHASSIPKLSIILLSFALCVSSGLALYISFDYVANLKDGYTTQFNIFLIMSIGIVLTLSKKTGGIIAIVLSSLIIFLEYLSGFMTSVNMHLSRIFLLPICFMIPMYSLFMRKGNDRVWQIIYNENRIPLLSLIIWNIGLFVSESLCSYCLCDILMYGMTPYCFMACFIPFMLFIGLVLLQLEKIIGLIIVFVSIVAEYFIIFADFSGFELLWTVFAFLSAISLFIRKERKTTFEILRNK